MKTGNVTNHNLLRDKENYRECTLKIQVIVGAIHIGMKIQRFFSIVLFFRNHGHKKSNIMRRLTFFKDLIFIQWDYLYLNNVCIFQKSILSIKIYPFRGWNGTIEFDSSTKNAKKSINGQLNRSISLTSFDFWNWVLWRIAESS